jgi:5-methylcytosine-specific restriction enzyme subunit McrC
LETLLLQEEEPKHLPETYSAYEIISLIHEKHPEKFSINYEIFLHDYKIQSNGYVGFIHLNENYSLQIKPKVKVENIFRMLEYAYKLKSFELLEGRVNIDSIEDIFERLATILAKQVLDRNRKGLYRGYISKTQSLPYLRGRIVVKPSVVSLLRGSTHPTCRYEENTYDLEENEILLWTLCKLHQFEIRHYKTKQAVRMAYRELINKVSLIQFHSQDCIDRFYNRLNIDYKPMHGICRFLLEHSGPNLEQGSHDFFPFVLYMPTLFESFVAEWLKENLPKKYRLKAQYIASLEPEKGREFRIDLIITNKETDAVECVLDTKYKKTKVSSTDDIAKVVAYAEKMLTKRAFLIYPSNDVETTNCQVGSIQVQSLRFNLDGDIEQSGALFLQSLLGFLEQ